MDRELQSWLQDFVQSPGFLRRYPYYAFILAKLDVVPDQAVDVMAVSRHRGRFYLHVNVDFFLQSPQYLRGILLHEVHHIVMGHLTQANFQDVDHPELLTLAMEMSANEYIREQLPGVPITWQAYRDFGIGAQQSTLDRYQRLVVASSSGAIIPQGDCVDDHIRDGLGSVATPRDSAWYDDWAENDVETLLHDAIEAVDADSSLADKGRLAGHEPGHWLEQLADSAESPRSFVDWKTALQVFVASIRVRLPTYTRVNRRFPRQIGVIPGRTYFPGSAREQQSLLIVIDTSASMSHGGLEEIARHLNVLHGLVKMTLVECDRVIQRVYPYSGTLPNVQGRGGTDLRPVFDDRFLKNHRVDGLVYFTDGQGALSNLPTQDQNAVGIDSELGIPLPVGRKGAAGSPAPGSAAAALPTALRDAT